MMIVTKDSTDVTSYFHLRLAADGTDATGLTVTNMDLQYCRSGATPAAKVDASALGAANSAHADNSAIEVDATDTPGLYRVDWPDAAFATGVDEVILTVKVATAFTESLRVRLISAIRGLAGTALPNAAADAAGGLPISDAGGLDLDAQIGTDIDAILVDTAEIGAAGAGLTNINLPNQTMDIVGSITGNLSGSVGSVTGAVGSVTATVNADVVSISGDSTAADNLETAFDDTAGAVRWTQIVDQGTAQSATGTTLVLRAAAAFADDELIGARIVITGGDTGVGQSRLITDYVSTTDTATVSSWTTTPSGTITYKIISDTAAAGGSAPTAAEVADAVWDEDATAHQSGGTFGQAIGDPGADTNTIFKAVVTDATGATVGVDVVAIKAETVEILADTAEIGAAGAGLTNINLPNQTMDIVGNITGNLSGSVGSVTGAVGSVTGAVGSVSAGGITAASIATDAIDADAMADGAITAATFAAGAITATVIATDAIDADALAADVTTELQSGLATAASLATVATYIDTEVAAIKAKTDQLTFTVANTVDANVEAVDGSATGVDKLAAHLPTVLKVIVGVGSTTTSIVLNATTGINGGAPSATNDFYNSRVLVFTSGTLANQAVAITDYVGATVTLTVSAATGSAAAADTGVIV